MRIFSRDYHLDCAGPLGLSTTYGTWPARRHGKHMLRDWRSTYPALFRMHDTGPLDKMDHEPAGHLAELLGLLKQASVSLVRKNGEVLMDIQDEAWAVEHPNKLQQIEALLKDHYDDIKRELWDFLDEA